MGTVCGTVLVVGTGQRATQATARSLRRAGFRVVGAGERGRLHGRTRYCDRSYRLPAPAARGFLDAVAAVCARERVTAVLPLFDEVQGALLAAGGAIGNAVVVGPTREQFERLSDKTGVVATAALAGVASPPSAVVGPDGASGPLPSLPSYVKIARSAYEGRPAGRPLRVTTRAERDRALDALRTRGETVVVQQELDGVQWRYDFVRGRLGHAALASRQLADQPYRVGQSTILRFEAMPPALASAAERLLDAVAYRSFGSIQFIETGVRLYVHDVNLRIPACVAGLVAAGLDMPRLAVEAALGTEPPELELPRRPLRYVWLQGEGLALREALRGGRGDRTPAAIAGSLVRAAVSPRDRLVPFDVTDPLPTLASIAAAVRAPVEVPQT